MDSIVMMTKGIKNSCRGNGSRVGVFPRKKPICIVSYMGQKYKHEIAGGVRMTADVEANVEFGKKVKRRLIDVGMTSRELAALLNVRPQYISSICTGRRSGIKYRRKIMEILGMDVA